MKSTAQAATKGPKKLTEAQIEEKAQEISKSLGGSKVHSFCFEENDEDGQVIGFLKEPTLQVKLRALDNIDRGEKIFATGSTLLDSLLIAEHTDPRILSGKSEYDQYYLGATTIAIGLCKVARNVIKKK